MSLADFSLADQQHYLVVLTKAASVVSCIDTFNAQPYVRNSFGLVGLI